ncbi:MAG: hypothetical protein HYU66_04180 [Armatimonadetes bacterium]|nr:hypothetical protein [Armatimonadota bacterium]
MRRKYSLKQYVDGYWQLVELCLVEGFGADAAAAERECAAWRLEVNEGWDVKQWNRLNILYHDTPLRVAFSLAIGLGLCGEHDDPYKTASSNGFDYDSERERVFSGRGRPEPATLRRAS